jgi:hypothetical protein
MFKKVVIATFVVLWGTAALSQNIQWNYLLLPGEVNVVAKDSSEKSMIIFRSRLFLYDSLQSVSRETGVAFFEYDYIAEFKNPQEVNHLVINFSGASRLMYYIRLYDEQNGTHIVYNYGAIRACDADIETMILTIAHTPYKVKKVEIGTFKGKADILKVGISNSADGNNVVQELVSLRLKSICNKASYFTDKIALTDRVNSTSFEVKPVISPDGKTLYFHRQNYKENTGGKKDDQDIYVSRLTNNEWSAAENIKGPLNDNLPNGVAAVSSGETSLFLINEYLAPNQQRQGLSFSEKTINGWSFPKKIEVKNFYNKSQYIDYFISPTQNEMILAVQRDDSFGDQDLYVSFYDDATSTWTEPLNLGSEVNSVISETSPFLAADGKTLYFASDGFLGYGGFDVYVTHRLDDSWTNWSFPENLGPIVNTFDDDLYYTVSAAGDQAYFVSTVNKDRNIYRIPLPAIYRPEPVVLLSGRIFNQGTALPEEAEVKVRWHEESDVIGSGKSDPVTGEYKLVIPAGGIYDYTISKNGFNPVTGTISTIKTKNYEEKEQHIKISEVSSSGNQKISILLDPAENEEQWKAKLETAALFVKAFPEYSISLEGNFYDSLLANGFETSNDLRNYLIKSGANAKQIKTGSSDSKTMVMQIASDSLIYYNESIVIPENYVRPAKPETNDIAVLVKGKVIDAATFKPVAARMIFKIHDKVKSRSSSDPASGNYQTVLPSNSQYQIILYQDSTEHHETYHAPIVTHYQETSMICLLNREKIKTVSFEIGSGISQNKNSDSQAKQIRFLKKKKATREILKLKNANEPMPPRLASDLIYLSEVLKTIPDMQVTIITHTAEGIAGETTHQQIIADRCIDFLIQNGVDKNKIHVKHSGHSQPKNTKLKHHTNNRIVAEVNFE